MPDNTSSPRAPRGRWRGRRWSRLAAVGLAGAFGLALAGPASALLPIADDGGGYQPEGGYGTEYDTGTEYTEPAAPTGVDDLAAAPGGGELAVTEAPPTDQAGQTPATNSATKTPEALTQETKDAVDGARAALANNVACRDLVGQAASGETGQQILDILAGAEHPPGKGRIVDDPNVEGKTTDGRPAMALAEDATNPRASGEGKGSGGTIHVFKQFHDVDLSRSPAFYNAATSTDGKQYVLTQAQGRVLQVLHELMHLTGALSASHTMLDPVSMDLDETEQSVIHMWIVTHCIPEARRESRPAPAGGGGGRPSSGDDGGPASVGPPAGGLGGGSAPLPESDDPVIDFDDPHGSDPVITGGDGTVIDGGYYSDDPVIIGDDGSVIDGGAVGPYPDPGEIDPGYGGGDYTDPGYDPCCDGGGGGDYWYDDLFRIEDEEYAY